MDRRKLIATGVALAGSSAFRPAQAQTQPQYSPQPQGPVQYSPPAPSQPAPPAPSAYPPSQYPADSNAMPPPAYGPNYKAETFSQDELVNRVSDFFGVTAEAAGGVVGRVFRDNGRPTGYIAGEEGSGAFFLGLRYGKGQLYMKHRDPQTVYWQGPSASFWDWGGNASRVFTLCYNLQYPDMIYRRYPGVEGSAYFIAGMGVNYQRAEDITLAPIRAGVGLRLGANIGYLAYTRERHVIPL